MTYDKFLALIKGIEGVYVDKYGLRYNRETHKDEGGVDCVSIKWTTGGLTGGSCWDTGDKDPHYALDSEPEPEFTDLDKILEAVCPNISFLQYKNMCSKLIKTDSESQNDYYNNYTNYAIKYILIEDLYNELKERKLIE